MICSGCGTGGDGPKDFVPPTPAQQQAIRNKEVQDIMNNPQIPANQKQQIINMTLNGPYKPAANATPAANTTTTN